MKYNEGTVPHSPPQLLSSSNVLVAEDDASVASNLEMMIDLLGAAKVHVAATVPEGLEAMASTQFNLAVVDMRLGVQSGLEIASRCLAKNVPFIISTGYHDVMEAGVSAGHICLLKPYSIGELADAVALALEPTSDES